MQHRLGSARGLRATERASRWPLTWRIAVSGVGILLLLNGSLRMSDDAWPFGPLSQYAFSPPADATIVITRVEGLTGADRINVPLVSWESGIGRAEIEARLPQIEADPSLLRTVAEGWQRTHADAPPIKELWLVQDVTALRHGRPADTRTVVRAHWVVA